MKYSYSDSTQNFESASARCIEDFTSAMLHFNYSLGTFKNNDRTNDSFEYAEAIGLDFDGGLTLNEAKLRFKKHKHIIATTRNHQKEKNGIIADRFRVILFLDKPITSAADFKYTATSLLSQNPQADPSCKDAARFFYPSTDIISTNMEGQTIPALKAPIKEVIQPTIQVGTKGALSRNTLEFLMFGADFNRNHKLYAAAKECQEQGYTQEEFERLAETMAHQSGTWYDTYLSDKDIDTIGRAFKEPATGEFRGEPPAFNFCTIGELYEDKTELEWTVQELLLKGGMSVLAGDPKSGKSTIARQLAAATLKGEKFLGRKCEKGKVVYLALEEHIKMIQQQFQRVGITKDEPMFVHVGATKQKRAVTQLHKEVARIKPSLLVIDTLSLFARFENSNDYEIVNDIMEQIREIPRQTGCHLLLVHHSNKGEGRGFNKIMGSQAIMGAVDTVMMFEVRGRDRYLTTTGRGVTNFHNLLLDYDPVRELYSFKREVTNDF